MTAAKQEFLEQLPPMEAGSPDPVPDEPHLHVVTEEDVKAAEIVEATQVLAAREFIVKFAANALSAVMSSEPYRTKLDGTKVPGWLYQYRRFRYAHELRPALARRNRAFAAHAAARTALLNLTAGVGEPLWPCDAPVTEL